MTNIDEEAVYRQAARDDVSLAFAKVSAITLMLEHKGLALKLIEKIRNKLLPQVSEYHSSACSLSDMINEACDEFAEIFKDDALDEVKPKEA